MSASEIVNKVWNYAHVLRDDGVGYGDYVEQITYLIFLNKIPDTHLDFDAKPASKTAWTKKLWFYDFRTNVHMTLKTKRMVKNDFDEFIKLYAADDRNKRKESAHNERWKSFNYDEIIARDKTNLDIFWMKDDSLEDTENLPAPEILAAEVVEQLEAALEEFRSVEDILGVKAYWLFQNTTK